MKMLARAKFQADFLINLLGCQGKNRIASARVRMSLERKPVD